MIGWYSGGKLAMSLGKLDAALALIAVGMVQVSRAASLPEWGQVLIQLGALGIVAFVVYRIFMVEAPAIRKEREAYAQAISELAESVRESVRELSERERAERQKAVEKIIDELGKQ